MTHLHAMIDPSLLVEMVDGGYVRVQRHPDLPLRIFNYTEKATYERVWNQATRQCRGLIVNDDDMIVARPLPKFFNHGEPSAAALSLDEPVVVTDKLDGSLGLLYPVGGGEYAVATRGSFISEQAQHATKVWRERYAHQFTVPVAYTCLFEIIYPANRIVLDYGDMDDLVHLGVVHIATGDSEGPDKAWRWPGPSATVFPYSSLTEALAVEPRPNAEGLVVHFIHSDERVKLKQDWYVQQHRLLTGLTARRLWERCAIHSVLADQPDTSVKRLGQNLRMDPKDVQAILDAGPDWMDEVRRTAAEEFIDWIDATVDDFYDRASAIRAEVCDTVVRFANVRRKDVAALIADHPQRGLIFAALDGKPITAQVWASIYPAHEKPFFSRTEDVA